MASLASPLPPSPPLPSPPSEDEEKTMDLWYVGAIINVIGSISINLGMNLMKLGHTKRGALEVPEEEKPPIRKFKSWLGGIIIFSTGNVLNFVSFAFAAQSLLAALGSLQMVCNVFFAFMVNHEPVTKLVVLSTLCIIGGCVLLVVFGNQSSETYTVQQLIHLYTLPAYVVYLVMMGVFVFGSYVLYLHAKKICRKRDCRGLWYALQLMSYSTFSALLGSQSVLFGKSMSVILRTTITGDNQLGNWYTWVVLPIFTFTALFWVTRLNKGLRMFPAMIIVPFMQIAWTLFSIVSGMLYFQEYTGFTTLKYIMFPVGVLVIFFGVYLLTIGNTDAPAPGDTPLEKGVEQASASGMTVHDNAMFGARPEGEARMSELIPAQQPKLSLGQTLRFMSTWAPASVAVSPGSVAGRPLMTNESMRRQRRPTDAPSELNATGRSNRTDEPADHPWNRTLDSALNRTAISNTSRVSETPSMMDTMRKGLKTVQNRLTNDLGVETKAGLKLAMGLGDGGLTAVSLFAMPALDFTATKRTSRSGGANETAILSALPRSRFYKTDADALTTIREASGLPTPAKGLGSEMGASLTTSSPVPGSSQGGQHTSSPATGYTSPETRSPSTRGDVAPPRPPSTRTPSRPHDEAALLGMLPGPSFRPATPPAGSGEPDPPTPSAAPVAAVRARRPSGILDGALPPPWLGPGVGAAPGRSGSRTPAPDPESPQPASLRPAGGSGGAQDAAPGPPGSSGRYMPRPGSLAALPDGVPLSTANSVVLHESRPSTPPDVMLAGAGASGAFQGTRLPSPLLGTGQLPPSPALSAHHTYTQSIPLSLLQRATAPLTAGVRLPPLHLVVPGMPVTASLQLAQPHRGAMQAGGGFTHHMSVGGSYAQILSGQLAPDAGLLGPMHGMTGGASMGGALVGGSPPAVRMMQPRQYSPRGLSVSRSWTGLSGMGGGSGASRQSPLQGGLITHMQKPLRPWQY